MCIIFLLFLNAGQFIHTAAIIVACREAWVEGIRIEVLSEGGSIKCDP